MPYCAVVLLKNRPFPLTAEDKTRLQNLAPLFDIHFRKMDKQACVLRTTSAAAALELAASLAYRRLLSELCEKTVSWIHFYLEASCRYSLLGRSDANLARLAVLYARNRQAAPNHAAIKSS